MVRMSSEAAVCDLLGYVDRRGGDHRLIRDAASQAPKLGHEVVARGLQRGHEALPFLLQPLVDVIDPTAHDDTSGEVSPMDPVQS